MDVVVVTLPSGVVIVGVFVKVLVVIIRQGLELVVVESIHEVNVTCSASAIIEPAQIVV